MLEKVMELHFLLYAMMLMGGLGALGMLTTHLTYRRMIRKNTEVKSNLKEKMDKSLENKRQAVEPYEPVCLVSVTFLYRFSWTGFFPVFQRCTMGRNAAGISLCGCDYSDSIAFAETGAGFYIQRRTSDEFFF